MNLTATYGNLNLTASPYALRFGADFGAPENVTQALAMLLQDGEIELTERTSNRTITFQVMIEGADLLELAEAEAALSAEANKRQNLLTISPGDSGPTTVYETYRGRVVWDRDDNHDMQRVRLYTVTMKALPAGRSEAEVVAVALGSGTMTVPPTITSVTVDDGSTTTGWAAAWTRNVEGTTTSGSATPTVVSGAVQASSSDLPSYAFAKHLTETIEETRTGSVDVSTTKQLVVLWKWDATGSTAASWRATDFQLEVNGTTVLSPVSGTTTPARGVTGETVFLVPAAVSTITSMRLVVSLATAGQVLWVSGTTRSLAIDDISRNNANASVSTPRQLQRVVDVAGTARTQGRLSVEHETSALGDVLVYCWPDTGQPYSPALRQFRTSGGAVTADSTLVSGARENLVGSTVVFTVPASRVPKALHTLMARVGGANTTATITWTATTVINGVDTGPTSTGVRSVPITTAYQILPLGRVDLPTRIVSPSASTAQVRFTITATVSSGSTANLDEMWFFATIGRLIQVACGTAAPSSGGSSNRLQVDPATADDPQPSVKIGFLSDGSDAAFPLSIPAWQPLEFAPGRVHVFTVTTNALDAAVTLRHYPRWDINAAS